MTVSVAVQTFFLVASHLPYLVDLLFAIWMAELHDAVVIYIMLLNSTLYHACLGDAFCIAPLAYERTEDYIGVTGILTYIMLWPLPVKAWVRFLVWVPLIATIAALGPHIVHTSIAPALIVVTLIA